MLTFIDGLYQIIQKLMLTFTKSLKHVQNMQNTKLTTLNLQQTLPP